MVLYMEMICFFLMKTNFNYTWDVFLFYFIGFSIFYVSLLELKEYIYIYIYKWMV